MSGTNSNPNFENGQTVLAATWNGTFAGKVDGANGNAIDLLINGGTMAGTFVAESGLMIEGVVGFQSAGVGTLIANGGTLTDMMINGGSVIGGTLSVQNTTASGLMQIVAGNDAGDMAIVDPLGFANFFFDHNGNFSQAGSDVAGAGFSVGATAFVGDGFLLTGGTIIAGGITITAEGATGFPVVGSLDPVFAGTLSVGALQVVPGTDTGGVALVDQLGFVSTLFDDEGNLHLSGTAIIEQGLSLSGSGIFGSFGSITEDGISGPAADMIVQLQTAVAPGFTGLLILDALGFAGAVIDGSGSSLVNDGGAVDSVAGLTGTVTAAELLNALISSLGTTLPDATGLPWIDGGFLAVS
jgi:hypothetical protein